MFDLLSQSFWRRSKNSFCFIFEVSKCEIFRFLSFIFLKLILMSKLYNFLFDLRSQSFCRTKNTYLFYFVSAISVPEMFVPFPTFFRKLILPLRNLSFELYNFLFDLRSQSYWRTKNAILFYFVSVISIPEILCSFSHIYSKVNTSSVKITFFFYSSSSIIFDSPSSR